MALSDKRWTGKTITATTDQSWISKCQPHDLPIWGTGWQHEWACVQITCNECWTPAGVSFLTAALRMSFQPVNTTQPYLLLTDWWSMDYMWMRRPLAGVSGYQTNHPSPSLSAFLLRREHSECHSSLLCQPGVVTAGPGVSGVAEGRAGPGPVSAAGRLAGLPHRRRLPGRSIPLRPRAGHGAVQSAQPTPQVESVCPQ